MNRRTIKRRYVHYLEWEDFHAGMWTKGTEEQIESARLFTSDHRIYGMWMRLVVDLWPRTMIHNLTNPSMNKRAFVGHCAVCLATGIPESVTRSAWKLLTDNQRRLADQQAQEAINQWYEKQN